jgi:hypothetical protein
MGILKTNTTWLRGPITRGISGRIERDGGDNGAGLIRQLAVVTRGEAIGHDVWLDRFFVRSAQREINEAAAGIKSRFTHPGMSGDGLARFLGRVSNAKLGAAGDIVRGDLHFSETSHKTPDGDLAEYVMDLAEQDPAAFGASIVFQHDEDAEDAMQTATGGKSADKRNEGNLRHARLKAGTLRAIDAVDEPAANPGGLFHAGDAVASQAEGLVSYALGLTEDLGDEIFDAFDVDPDRLRRFVVEFMDRHGLALVEAGEDLDGIKARMGHERGIRMAAEAREILDGLRSDS